MLKSRSRFTLWAAMLAAIITVLMVPAQTAQASTVFIVNDAGDGCGINTPGYVGPEMLQTAIDDAIALGVHTILVCPGLYDPLTITGANKLTLKAALPDTFPTINAPAASS